MKILVSGWIDYDHCSVRWCHNSTKAIGYIGKSNFTLNKYFGKIFDYSIADHDYPVAAKIIVDNNANLTEVKRILDEEITKLGYILIDKDPIGLIV